MRSLSPQEQASFNFMAAVTNCNDFGAQEYKLCHCFRFLPIYLPWNNGTGCHDLSFFEYWVSSQPFHSLSPSSRGSLAPLHFLPLEWYQLHIWGCWYFSWKSWFQLVIPPVQHFARCTLHMGFPSVSEVKSSPAMQELRVWCLGREDPLEKGTATHSSIPAWRIPWTEEPGGLQSLGSQRIGHD